MLRSLTFNKLAEGEDVYGLTRKRLVAHIKTGAVVGAVCEGGRYSALNSIGAVGTEERIFILPDGCGWACITPKAGSAVITRLELNRPRARIGVKAMPGYLDAAVFELHAAEVFD